MSSNMPKMCLSLMPENKAQLTKGLKECLEADLVEIRLDLMPDLELESWVRKCKKPMIATLRSKNEGGHWNGTAKNRLEILQAAADAEVAYIDVEFQHAKTLLKQLKRTEKTRIVLSRHTEERNPEELRKMMFEMQQVPADVYKLIFSAQSLHDSRNALTLIEEAKAKGLTFVIHAMEVPGQVSRILGALAGNAWTYVSREEAEETAGGQLSLHDARHYFNLHQKKVGETRILGLVGDPLHQSKGWRIHNRLFQAVQQQQPGALKEEYLYCNFPTGNPEEFWKDWSGQLHGLSITIPHKESMLRFADEQAPEVRISGVCNTLVRTANGWRAHNTDLLAIEGLLRPIRESIRNGGMVIGTGATARSAIAALKRLEVTPIFVVGRNEERGRILSSLFGVDFLHEDEVHYARAMVVIQTTPVGMVPRIEEYPVGTSMFRKGRVVMDVVYNPAETRFLKIARGRQCEIINGVEMFLNQAARQFELFTGVTLQGDLVRQVWEEVG
ncbi:MAG: type I 3-dehydroquinate dehydratase [Calditrichaeota bacterium]|nr:type I 3-dehydroquinate dehydratase [Calditrichota bacterium]HQU71236.1 type I 3-dehydroquinate dehydratase [Calditrichia bacterium]